MTTEEAIRRIREIRGSAFDQAMSECERVHRTAVYMVLLPGTTLWTKTLLEVDSDSIEANPLEILQCGGCGNVVVLVRDKAYVMGACAGPSIRPSGYNHQMTSEVTGNLPLPGLP